MVDISEKLTQQVANLAKLELSEDEVKTFTFQLGEIVKYIDQLQQVNVSGVDPLTHPLEKAPSAREDRVEPFPLNSAGKPKTLDAAPETLDDGFKVPPII